MAKKRRNDAPLVTAIIFMAVVSFFLGKAAIVTEGEPKKAA
jgi:hypothetical protein